MANQEILSALNRLRTAAGGAVFAGPSSRLDPSVPPGVHVAPLELSEGLLGTLFVPEESVELRTHFASLTGGLDVTFPDHFQELQPLVVSLPAEGAHHLTVHVGRDARATVAIESSGEAQQWSHSCEALVEEGGVLDIVFVHRVSSNVPSRTWQRASVGEGGEVTWRNVTLNDGKTVQDVKSVLHGAHARSSVDWAFYADADDSYALNVRNVFDGRSGGGEVTMRGIADEGGHATAKGMIDIGLGGGGTNTYLTQDVLMLDKTAKVDAVPALEIKTNDVKASHSATVSRATAEDLFYFASRGIGEREAKRMFVLGFAGSLLQRVGDGALRERITGYFEEKYDR